MNWDALGTMAAALMAFIALNAGTLRWLFERHESVQVVQIASLKREGSDFSHEIEREVMRLKAQLPLEYVRREDWIRFSSTLDAKLDAMRAELRDEINELKERLGERVEAL
jgi:DNA anti-recombination protein RmuC